MLILNNTHTTKDKPIYTGSMSAYPYSYQLQAYYTFKTPFDEEVCGVIKEGNTLLVPRESVPYAEAPNDFRVSYPVSAINCNFTPRYNQQELCDQSLKLLQAGKNHIFESPTGSGKSVMGAYIACQMGQPTLIVVTKDDLVSQWRDTFIKILGIPEKDIGHIQQNACDWKDKKFVIGMVHSLIIPDRYAAEMYKYFGMVIFDEVHQMATDCFIRACQLFPAKYRLGFSATPTRKDGKTKLLHWNIGPNLVKGSIVALKPKILVRQTGWKIPTKRMLVGNSYEQVPIPHGPGRMMLVYKAMANNDFRNMEITNFVLQAYKAERNCVVLADTIDHLNRLFQIITGKGIAGNEIGYYIGGMSKLELNLSKVKKIVLGTYKMCSTGTDVPRWDSLVMATPRADVKQIIGRVMREFAGKKQPIVLDLVDFNSIFQNFHLSRVSQYHSVGAHIVKV